MSQQSTFLDSAPPPQDPATSHPQDPAPSPVGEYPPIEKYPSPVEECLSPSDSISGSEVNTAPADSQASPVEEFAASQDEPVVSEKESPILEEPLTSPTSIETHDALEDGPVTSEDGSVTPKDRSVTPEGRSVTPEDRDVPEKRYVPEDRDVPEKICFPETRYGNPEERYYGQEETRAVPKKALTAYKDYPPDPKYSTSAKEFDSVRGSSKHGRHETVVG